jgi:hypothetical protein
MAKSADCKCEAGRFTCGHCLRNAPPYFFTLSDGSAIYGGPADMCQPSEAARERLRAYLATAGTE